MSDTPHVDPTPPAAPPEPVPRGQRFFDNVHLLLALGVLIMIVLWSSQ